MGGVFAAAGDPTPSRTHVTAHRLTAVMVRMFGSFGHASRRTRRGRVGDRTAVASFRRDSSCCGWRAHRSRAKRPVRLAAKPSSPLSQRLASTPGVSHQRASDRSCAPFVRVPRAGGREDRTLMDDIRSARSRSIRPPPTTRQGSSCRPTDTSTHSKVRSQCRQHLLRGVRQDKLTP